MRERTSGTLFAVFQPHGYKPFGFMESQLFEYMEQFLRPHDRFILLEPFYAGGTSSFSPSAVEIHAKWKKLSKNPERFITLPDRDTVKEFLNKNAHNGDIVTIMGARDNSLSDFAAGLCD
jgi:UDP-N-acetylmuramate--alanine ligase